MNNKKPKIDIDVNDLPLHRCTKCNNTSFVAAFEIRILSILLSPTGKQEIINTPVAACSICGQKVLNGDLDGTNLKIVN